MVATFQEIVYAFLQTYYQRMKTNPSKLSNLYSSTSELTHINYNQINIPSVTTNDKPNTAANDLDILPTIKIAGKDNINKFFTRHENKVNKLKVKLDTCDFQTTGLSHKNLLIVVTGELFWVGTPVYQFCQTFILVPVAKNSEIYDISNDILRFIPDTFKNWIFLNDAVYSAKAAETMDVKPEEEATKEKIETEIRHPMKTEKTTHKQENGEIIPNGTNQPTPVFENEKVKVEKPNNVKITAKPTKKEGHHANKSVDISTQAKPNGIVKQTQEKTPPSDATQINENSEVVVSEPETKLVSKKAVVSEPEVKTTSKKSEVSEVEYKSSSKKTSPTEPETKQTSNKIVVSEPDSKLSSKKATEPESETQQPTKKTETKEPVESVAKTTETKIEPPVEKKPVEKAESPKEPKEVVVEEENEEEHMYYTAATTAATATATAAAVKVTSETTTKTEATPVTPETTSSPQPPTKLSWASKLSTTEPTKESKKILVAKTTGGTTIVTTEPPSQTHHNQTKNKKSGNDKKFEMGSRKDNSSNRRERKKRSNSNTNKDSYYPVFINGTYGLSDETLKNKLSTEFGPVIKVNSGENFAVIDFANHASQLSAIEKKKMMIEGFEITMERKTSKKANLPQNSNNARVADSNGFISSSKSHRKYQSGNKKRENTDV